MVGSQKIVPEIERSRNRNVCYLMTGKKIPEESAKRFESASGEKEMEVGSERLKFLMTSVQKYLIL